MSRAYILFASATLLPVPLLVAGALGSGAAAWAALIYMTALTAGLDRVMAVAAPNGPDGPGIVTDGLPVALALAHFGLLAVVVAGLGGEAAGPAHKLALFLSAGLYFGQVSNSNAHELIHRRSRWLNRLGRWVYVSLLFGHHASAHPLVHHVHVGTDRDPNSARLGQGYYRFLIGAWVGSFRAGLRAETDRLARAGLSGWRHPYFVHVGGSLLCLGLAALIGGATGPVWLLLLAGHAQSQLLLSDYVQHYGLRRRIGPNGRADPVGPEHSWNSPHRFSSALMLNAPRHSDHHAHPDRAFPALALDSAMPVLPRGLPAMAALALVPPLWRRVMDPRVRALTAT